MDKESVYFRSVIVWPQTNRCFRGRARIGGFLRILPLSSSLYIFNDWVDADEDRAHPEKCLRPISSGELPASLALFASICISVIALALAGVIGIDFAGVAVMYFVLITAYCLSLKRFMVLDCIVIATGFVFRVVGGATAIAVTPTHWLIACAFLLALFLAFAKRRQELLKLSSAAAEHREVLGRYTVSVS